MTTANPTSKTTLPPPFTPAFTRADKKRREVLVPNLSRSFSIMSSAVFRSLGYKSSVLPLADADAQRLGKRYVHNDICYPAQINIGEFLNYMNSGKITPQHAALVLAKNCRDCRAGQYAALARKALDDAGYKEAAILTTAPDNKGMHPGFFPGVRFSLRMLAGIVISDALDAMVHKTRPYEHEEGSVERLYEIHVHRIAEALVKSVSAAHRELAAAVTAFNEIPLDRATRKPRVFVIGEILMNYHDTANRDIVRYLERHGMEVILPDILSFFWRQVITDRDAVRRKMVKHRLVKRIVAEGYDFAYRHAFNKVEGIYSNFRFYEPRPDISELADNIGGFVDKTLIAGEGWLIPAEIMHNATRGISSFVIIQPFGCLPNQITGRGLMRPLKEKYPHINILAIDYDNDVSMANIENRLQMLVMASKGFDL